MLELVKEPDADACERCSFRQRFPAGLPCPPHPGTNILGRSNDPAREFESLSRGAGTLVSRTGKLACLGAKRIASAEVADGEHKSVCCLAFNPGGDRIAVGLRIERREEPIIGELVLLDLEGTRLRTVPMPHPVRSIHWREDATLVLGCDRKLLTLWSIDAGEFLAEVTLAPRPARGFSMNYAPYVADMRGDLILTTHYTSLWRLT